MKDQFRCVCPFTSALDILGDRWSLVIIKQMLFEGMETFKDFLEADEAIASGILAARLKMLQEARLITKEKLPGNLKSNSYRPTQKAIALVPALVELALWSDGNIREFHPMLRNDSEMDYMRNNKAALIEAVQARHERTADSD